MQVSRHRWAGSAILWVWALALLCCLAGPTLAQPKFPALSGRIVDEARILSTQDRVELEALLKELEGKSSDQIVIYTAKSLQGYEIEDFGYQLGRFWKIGQAGINNGILLIVAPNEKKVRIEVGRGLEGQMTDLLSGVIVRNAILPAFRRGDFPGGIKAGTRDIKDVLLGDAEAVRERAKSIKSRQPGFDVAPLIVFGIFILIWFLILRKEMQQARQQPASMQRRRQGGRVIVAPGGWGGSSNWPSGGGWSSGGGSSDSGGFSGGGGDFGGGGASGSW
jgi:uncharacterized protein